MQTDIFNNLKQVHYFTHLADETLQSLAQHAVIKSYPKNSFIINEGDESGSLHIVLTGKVRVLLSDKEGREVTLGFEGPGQYFGELAILDDSPRSASVVTTEKSSCIVISKSIFKNWLTENPEANLAIIRGLVQTIRDLTSNVKGLALLDVYGRLIKILRKMSIDQNDVTVIPERPTQQELANMVGASREMVTRIFRDLNIGGYITLEGKSLIINKKLPPSW